jgi:hypothetical protein
MASIEMQISERLSRYLGGLESVAEFHDWFIPATWNIEAEQAADPDAVRLAHKIQLLLAEFSSEHWSEEELRQNLWLLMPQPHVTLSFGEEPFIVSGTSTATQRSVGSLEQSVGTRFVEAYS